MSSVTTTLESFDSIMDNKPMAVHHKAHVILTPLPNFKSPSNSQFGINEGESPISGDDDHHNDKTKTESENELPLDNITFSELKKQIPSHQPTPTQTPDEVDEFIFDYCDYYRDSPRIEPEEQNQPDLEFTSEPLINEGSSTPSQHDQEKIDPVSHKSPMIKPTSMIIQETEKGKSPVSNPTLAKPIQVSHNRRDTISTTTAPISTALAATSPASANRHRSHPPPPRLSIETDNNVQAKIRESVIIAREKRRRSKWQEDDRVLVGTKVSEGHVNYVTAYNMLTGIRVSVSRCNAKVDQTLVDQDFSAKNKLAFDISGNELTPSAKYDFKFKDYSPLVFRHLRELFRLDPADYLMSLTSKYIVSELGSPGKSGSFFYFSRDYRFIIKTIHHAEHRMLRKVLKDYYNHVKANPNTLISQFYGLHRVKLPYGRKIHFVVMNNLFPPYREINRTYDLKGSFVGRETRSSQEIEAMRRTEDKKKSLVLKDLNWLKNDDRILLGPTKRDQLFKQLEKDVKLLEKLNMMDYSLLIGISELKIPQIDNINHDDINHNKSLRGLSYFGPDGPPHDALELRKAIHEASPTVLEEFELLPNVVEMENFRSSFLFYHDIGGFQATDENNEPMPIIYYLGIIDCLTGYGLGKKIETFWKGFTETAKESEYERLPKSMANERLISAVPAREYGERFLKFMRTITGKSDKK